MGCDLASTDALLWEADQLSSPAWRRLEAVPGYHADTAQPHVYKNNAREPGVELAGMAFSLKAE